MKNKIIWKILLFLGICPFILPVVVGIYKINTESWAFLDWMIMYSFIYWPTYVIGAILMVVSVLKLRK